LFEVGRRKFMTLLGGAVAAWPLAAGAALASEASGQRGDSKVQQPERMRRIGVLMPLAESDVEAQRRIVAFVQALQDMGWSAGRTLALEIRYADGKPELLPALASELVRFNVDVIVTQAAQPVEAAIKATSTIPIVMATVGDAVGGGYVASLARPGGNVTGQTLIATGQSTKRLQLLKELSSDINRVAVLWNRNASGHRLQFNEMEAAAPVLNIDLLSLPITTTSEVETALRAAKQGKAQAIVTMEDPMIQAARARVVEFAIHERMPSIGEFRPMVAAGGLMSYGGDQIQMWRGAAAYVDKILKGAQPGDLPVQQPTKFTLAINLKTANALGLAIPPILLAVADEVIE
jgi:putative ABC transport system substrate-binding protein